MSPIPCNRCKQPITFDDGILSITGKKIPLTADKTMTHGHDEQGRPINKPLEPGQQVVKQQQQQQQPYQQEITNHSQEDKAKEVPTWTQKD